MEIRTHKSCRSGVGEGSRDKKEGLIVREEEVDNDGMEEVMVREGSGDREGRERG